MSAPWIFDQHFSKLFLSGGIAGLPIRLGILLVATLILPRLRSWFRNMVTDIDNYLFVTAHTSATAGKWVLAWMYLDDDVQQQLLQYRLIANDNQASIIRKGQPVPQIYLGDEAVGSTRAGATYVKDGVWFRKSPLTNHTIFTRHQGKRLWITRHSDPRNFDRTEDIRITVYRWNQPVIIDFLLHAHSVYREKQDNEIHIYTHSVKPGSGSAVVWEGPIIRPARPWSSVILPGTVKDDLLQDVQNFTSVQEKEWYTSKGIPHRRGYLLYGPPGTGKTTLVTALAGRLRMDLYIVNPAAPGMDDSQLQKAFRKCPQNSLLLIEDIDCVMPLARGQVRGPHETLDGRVVEHEPAKSSDGPKRVRQRATRGSAKPPEASDSKVTLSGLLNAIDGVASQEDSVLFASTNHPDQLDEALRRPGRFDVHVPFGFAAHQQAVNLFKHFYPPMPSSEPGLKPSNNALNGVTKDAIDLDSLATRFADKIVESNIKLSIAAMQAYLLLYKKDACMAVKKVDDWINSMRREQDGEGVIRPQGQVNGSMGVLTPPVSPL